MTTNYRDNYKVIYTDRKTHKKLRLLAAHRDTTLGKVVKEIMEDYFKGKK